MTILKWLIWILVIILVVCCYRRPAFGGSLYVTATWCPTCKIMDSRLKPYDVIKIDYDTHKQWCRTNGVVKVPALWLSGWTYGVIDESVLVKKLKKKKETR